MREVLQEGTVRKVPASENAKQRAVLLGAGGAKKAADETAPATRRARLEEEEKKATGYAKGGPVKRGWGKARSC